MNAMEFQKAALITKFDRIKINTAMTYLFDDFDYSILFDTIVKSACSVDLVCEVCAFMISRNIKVDSDSVTFFKYVGYYANLGYDYFSIIRIMRHSFIVSTNVL